MINPQTQKPFLPVSIRSLDVSMTGGERDYGDRKAFFDYAERLLLPHYAPFESNGYKLHSSDAADWLSDEAEMNWMSQMAGKTLEIRIDLSRQGRQLAERMKYPVKEIRAGLQELSKQATEEMARTNIHVAGPECWRDAMVYGDSVLMGKKNKMNGDRFEWEVIRLPDVVLGRAFSINETQYKLSRTPIFIRCPGMSFEDLRNEYGGMASWNYQAAIKQPKVGGARGGGLQDVWLAWFSVWNPELQSSRAEINYMCVFRKGEMEAIVGEEITDPFVAMHVQYGNLSRKTYGWGLSHWILPIARKLDEYELAMVQAVHMQALAPWRVPAGSLSKPEMTIRPGDIVEYDPDVGVGPEAITAGVNMQPFVVGITHDQNKLNQRSSRGTSLAQSPDRTTALAALNDRQQANRVQSIRGERMRTALIGPLIRKYIPILIKDGLLPSKIFGLNVRLEGRRDIFDLVEKTNIMRQMDQQEAEKVVFGAQIFGALQASGIVNPDEARAIFDQPALLSAVSRALDLPAEITVTPEELLARLAEIAAQREAMAREMMAADQGGGAAAA